MQKTEESQQAPYWSWLPASFALAGVIVFIFATYGPPASSSGFVVSLKALLSPLAPEHVASNEHYSAVPGPGSWLLAFVVGMALGGFLGGRSFTKPIRDVPELWEKKFGPDRKKRYAATFLGGFLILFGARLAGGCTLGLFISGSTQLAASGLYFGVLIFIMAILTARWVYLGKGRVSP